jgi:hypothetical protein
MKSVVRTKIKPIRRLKGYDFSFTSKSPYPRDVSLGKQTLKIAQQNIAASRLLSTQGFLPEAVFFLQQSIEKGCKAYGYFYGFINEDIVMKKINHQSPKVYSRALFEYDKILTEAKKTEEKNKAMRFIDRLDLPVLSHIEKNIKSALDISKSIEGSQLPLPTENRLLELTQAAINLSNEMHSEKNQFETEDYINKIIEKYNKELNVREVDLMNKLHRLLYHNFRARYKIQASFKDLKNLPKNEIMDYFIINFYRLYTVKSLLLMGYITQPHESNTRYASTKHNFNPLKYYSSSISIIQHLPTLTNICQDNLNDMEKIFSYDESKGGAP